MAEHFCTPDELAAEDPLRRSASEFAGYSGPPLTDDVVRRAELILGVKLPVSLLELLRESNGGFLKRRYLPISEIDDVMDVQAMAGIGWEGGLDGEFGSMYMSSEWEYPEGLIWLAGDGHWGVFLDYRTCGTEGEASVVFYDTEESCPTVRAIANDFSGFLRQLRAENEL